MNDRVKALRDAISFWEGKPDPKNAEYGTYVCDSCGGPIMDKQGTSLHGGWMRCSKCTDRAFPVQHTQDEHNINKSDNTSTSKKAVEKQSCKKCGHIFNKDKMTCPNCGNTKWGEIISVLIVGIVLVVLVIPIGFNGGKVFIAIIFGVLGLIISLGCMIYIKTAIKTRNKVKKEMTKKVAEGKVGTKIESDLDSTQTINDDENVNKEQAIEYNSNPRHYTGSVNLQSLYVTEPSRCLLCQDKTQLNSAIFYFGSLKQDHLTVGLVTETKTKYVVYGHKSYYFCNNCIEKMLKDRIKMKNKYVLRWIGGSLLFLILLFTIAALEIKILISGILIAGVVSAILYVPKMMKNKNEWIALSKKGGKTKFEDFLDSEALRLFLKDKNEDIFTGVAFWTRNDYRSIFK